MALRAWETVVVIALLVASCPDRSISWNRITTKELVYRTQIFEHQQGCQASNYKLEAVDYSALFLLGLGLKDVSRVLRLNYETALHVGKGMQAAVDRLAFLDATDIQKVEGSRASIRDI